MGRLDKRQEYDNLLNQIKVLSKFTEKDSEKIIEQVVKGKIGCKAEAIKQEYKENKDPELNPLRSEVLKAYYSLMKKTIFQKELVQYKCVKSYSPEAKTRLVNTANEKIEQLPNEICFRDMNAEEVKDKATLMVKKLEISKRYLGEVLKSGEGIAKIDNIHRMFETYVGINDAVKDWVTAERIKAAKEMAAEVGRTLFGVMVEVGTLTTNVLKEFAKDNNTARAKGKEGYNWAKEMEQERITANKHDLKMQLHSAICNNDFKKVDEINEEIKAYNSRNGRDRYEDVRFL